jgi:hypothetical protein
MLTQLTNEVFNTENRTFPHQVKRGWEVRRGGGELVRERGEEDSEPIKQKTFGRGGGGVPERGRGEGMENFCN